MFVFKFKRLNFPLKVASLIAIVQIDLRKNFGINFAAVLRKGGETLKISPG